MLPVHNEIGSLFLVFFLMISISSFCVMWWEHLWALENFNSYDKYQLIHILFGRGATPGLS